MNGKQAKRARKVANFHPARPRATMVIHRLVKKIVLIPGALGKQKPVLVDRITLKHEEGITPRWRYQEAKKFFRGHNHIEKGRLTKEFRAGSA